MAKVCEIRVKVCARYEVRLEYWLTYCYCSMNRYVKGANLTEQLLL